MEWKRSETVQEKRKNDSVPRRDLSFFQQLWLQVRLSWALLKDSRVPLTLKAIPLAALVYTLSPIDLIPDVIPILGQLDDLGVLMAALTTFNRLAPPDIVEEHTQRLRTKTVIPPEERVHRSPER